MSVKDNLIKVHGRDYLKVAGRVLAFRADFPLLDEEGQVNPQVGRIHTDILEGDQTRVRASIYVGDVLIATGLAEAPEGFKGQNIGGRILEKVETNAIGRALALCGYGTQVAFQDDDGDEVLADSPIQRGGTPPPTRSNNGGAQPKTGDKWRANVVRTKISQKGKPYYIVTENDSNERGAKYASTYLEELFREAGYSTEGWDQEGEHELPETAIITLEMRGNYMNIKAVEKA